MTFCCLVNGGTAGARAPCACAVAPVRFIRNGKFLEEHDPSLAEVTFSGREQGKELFSRRDSLSRELKRGKERSKRWGNVKTQKY